MYVYGWVPPDVVLVKVTLLPVSIVVAEAVMVMVGSALTVTVIEFEDDAVEPNLSTTFIVTENVPVSLNVMTLPT